MIVITLPLPVKALSPNGRPNRWDKARAVKAARGLTYLTIKEQAPEIVGQQWNTATIQYHFYFATNRNRDDDNASGSMKSYRDAFGPTTYWKSGKKVGMVKGIGTGTIKDDSGFTEIKPTLNIDKSNPRVEIHIERTE